MHKLMYREFRRIFAGMNFTGSVLEVGATPDNSSLLAMPELEAASERVGLNLDGPHDFSGFHIDKGDANRMPYEAERFDCVLCNAVLEHVPTFWNVVDEIKRVTRPGGLIVIGVPGYRSGLIDKWQGRLARISGPLANRPYLNAIFRATPTFQIHNEPGDYYRFSPQALEGPIMGDLVGVKVWSVMIPPRLIATGRKPH